MGSETLMEMQSRILQEQINSRNYPSPHSQPGWNALPPKEFRVTQGTLTKFDGPWEALTYVQDELLKALSNYNTITKERADRDLVRAALRIVDRISSHPDIVDLVFFNMEPFNAAVSKSEPQTSPE